MYKEIVMAHTLSDLIQSMGDILVEYLNYVTKNKENSPFKASIILKQPNYQTQLADLIARIPDKNINRKVLLTFLLDEIVYLKEFEKRIEPLNNSEEKRFKHKLIQLLTDLNSICQADKKNEITAKVIRLEQDAPVHEKKIFGCSKKGYWGTIYCTSGTYIEKFIQKKFELNSPLNIGEVEQLVDMIFIDLDKTIKANAFLTLQEQTRRLQSELIQAKKDLENVLSKNNELEKEINALKSKPTDPAPNSLGSVLHITRTNLFANHPIYRNTTNGDLKTLVQELGSDEDQDSFGILAPNQ